jgi:peptidoglycan hydrolase-like protein with peptidoglycan-binding domain
VPHDELEEVSSRAYPSLERSPGKSDNWLEAAGGLPSYIERISKHLHYEKGMSISHAIATGVNTVKRWCTGGTVSSTKGPTKSNNVKPETKAKACAAVAEWEAKKAAGKAKKLKESTIDTEAEVLTDDDKRTLIEASQKRLALVENLISPLGRPGARTPTRDAALELMESSDVTEVKMTLGGRRLTKDEAAETRRLLSHERAELRALLESLGAPPAPPKKNPLDDALSRVDKVSKMSDADRLNIERGSSGEEVKLAQTRLSELGYQVQPDGEFGPVTDTAVKSFQGDHGLKVDGKLHRQTRMALRGTTTEDVAERKGVAPESIEAGPPPEAAASPDAPTPGDPMPDGAPAPVSGNPLDANPNTAAATGGVPAPQSAADAANAAADGYEGEQAPEGDMPDSEKDGAESVVGGNPEVPLKPFDWLTRGRGVDGEPDPKVKMAQTALEKIGTYVGEDGPDGRFGPETEAGTMRVQRRFGLKPDGLIGPKTNEVLERYAPDVMKAEAKADPDEDSETDESPEAEAAEMDKAPEPDGDEGEDSKSGPDGDGDDGDDKKKKKKLPWDKDVEEAATQGTDSKYDEKKHPRGQKGTPQGGQFVSKGDSGAEVKGLQAELGLEEATGTFDAETVEAVKDYQRENGLQVDGVVGSQTAASMQGREAKVGSLSKADKRFLRKSGKAALEEASLRGAAGRAIGGLRDVTQIKRLPNGEFAPKGRGMVLRPGQEVSVPRRRGESGPNVRGKVNSRGKVELLDGPDKGTTIDVQGASGQASPPVPKGVDLRSFQQSPEGGGPKIDVGSDVNRAADLLATGHRVQLDQPRTVSILLDELDKRVKNAIELGDDAPNFNLCDISVPNTNLFCAESKGIPRVHMPQLSGVPLPGSKADSMEKNDKGEVDLSDLFRQSLIDEGIAVEEATEKAAYLRATQNELNGAKVAGIAGAVKSGKLDLSTKSPLFVSQDNYIVDGHHRWAALVGVDAEDGKLGDEEGPEQRVERIDLDIIEILERSNAFAEEFGIPQAAVGDNKALEAEKAKKADAPGDGQASPGDADGGKSAKRLEREAKAAEAFPLGSRATTEVFGIGGRSEMVSGEVVGHDRGFVEVKTENHGTLAVELGKAMPEGQASPDPEGPMFSPELDGKVSAALDAADAQWEELQGKGMAERSDFTPTADFAPDEVAQIVGRIPLPEGGSYYEATKTDNGATETALSALDTTDPESLKAGLAAADTSDLANLYLAAQDLNFHTLNEPVEAELTSRGVKYGDYKGAASNKGKDMGQQGAGGTKSLDDYTPEEWAAASDAEKMAALNSQLDSLGFDSINVESGEGTVGQASPASPKALAATARKLGDDTAADKLAAGEALSPLELDGLDDVVTEKLADGPDIQGEYGRAKAAIDSMRGQSSPGTQADGPMTEDDARSILSDPAYDAYGGFRLYGDLADGQRVSIKSNAQLDKYLAQDNPLTKIEGKSNNGYAPIGQASPGIGDWMDHGGGGGDPDEGWDFTPPTFTDRADEEAYNRQAIEREDQALAGTRNAMPDDELPPDPGQPSPGVEVGGTPFRPEDAADSPEFRAKLDDYQRRFTEAADALGIENVTQGEQKGVWSGDAEPSVVTDLGEIPSEQGAAAAALLGKHYGQDAMAVFAPGDGEGGRFEVDIPEGMDDDAIIAKISEGMPDGQGASFKDGKAYFYAHDFDEGTAWADGLADALDSQYVADRGTFTLVSDNDYGDVTYDQAIESAGGEAGPLAERWRSEDGNGSNAPDLNGGEGDGEGQASPGTGEVDGPEPPDPENPFSRPVPTDAEVAEVNAKPFAGESGRQELGNGWVMEDMTKDPNGGLLSPDDSVGPEYSARYTFTDPETGEGLMVDRALGIRYDEGTGEFSVVEQTETRAPDDDGGDTSDYVYRDLHKPDGTGFNSLADADEWAARWAEKGTTPMWEDNPLTDMLVQLNEPYMDNLGMQSLDGPMNNVPDSVKAQMDQIDPDTGKMLPPGVSTDQTTFDVGQASPAADTPGVPDPGALPEGTVIEMGVPPNSTRVTLSGPPVPGQNRRAYGEDGRALDLPPDRLGAASVVSQPGQASPGADDFSELTRAARLHSEIDKQDDQVAALLDRMNAATGADRVKAEQDYDAAASRLRELESQLEKGIQSGQLSPADQSTDGFDARAYANTLSASDADRLRERLANWDSNAWPESERTNLEAVLAEWDKAVAGGQASPGEPLDPGPNLRDMGFGEGTAAVGARGFDQATSPPGDEILGVDRAIVQPDASLYQRIGEGESGKVASLMGPQWKPEHVGAAIAQLASTGITLDPATDPPESIAAVIRAANITVEEMERALSQEFGQPEIGVA